MNKRQTAPTILVKFSFRLKGEGNPANAEHNFNSKMLRSGLTLSKMFSMFLELSPASSQRSGLKMSASAPYTLGLR